MLTSLWVPVLSAATAVGLLTASAGLCLARSTATTPPDGAAAVTGPQPPAGKLPTWLLAVVVVLAATGILGILVLAFSLIHEALGYALTAVVTISLLRFTLRVVHHSGPLVSASDC